MSVAVTRLVSERSFPPYAYIGEPTQPHPCNDPRGHSYGLSEPKPAPLEPDRWRESEDYLFGIDLFNHGYYWEAHEAWEGLWVAAGKRGRVAEFLKGLIKLTAAGVKVRQGRVEGIRKHSARAVEHFRKTAAGFEAGERTGEDPRFAGLSLDWLEAFAGEIGERAGEWPRHEGEGAIVVFDRALEIENVRDLARLRVLILAGGASSRFFPLNKVLADPTGRGRTLIQQAFDRVVSKPLYSEEGEGSSLVDRSRFHVVTGESSREAIRRQLDLDVENIFVEPARRNTWPAILWALAHLRRLDSRATIAILTADHIIGDEPAFRSTLVEAVRVAQSSPAIVTIGITPSERSCDWTSFGAIKAAESDRPGLATGALSACRIQRFEEKPSESRAAEMLAEGGWTWNSGMFVFDLATAEAALERFQPDMAARYREVCAAVASGGSDQDSARAAQSFERISGKIPHPGILNWPGPISASGLPFICR